MKKLISRYWLVLLALVSVTLFTACSSDDDEATTPVFPQVQTIAGAAGDVKEFSFDANENWSLSSSKIWCQIVKSDAEEGAKAGYVLNGTAGKQTIKVTLTDDEESKDLSVAQLNLKMGGQEVAIAEVHRSAAGYELKVYDEAGNDISETGIVAGYDEYAKFSVKANYRFAATNMPSWVELDGGFLVGRPNELVSGGAMFKEGVRKAQYAIAKSEGEFMTFASEDGKAEVSVPVIYNGLPTNTMDVTYPTDSRWATWEVSLDGKTLTQTSSSSISGDGTTNKFTYSNFLPFTLKTAGDDYTLVVFNKHGVGLEPDYSRFVKTTGEGGEIRLTIDALQSGERECYVYAMPTSLYESLSNPESMINSEEGVVDSEYDRYFLMHFVQKEEKEDGSKAPEITTYGYLPVECVKNPTAEYKEYAAMFEYSGNEIYEATVPAGSYVNIQPQIDGWDISSGVDDAQIAPDDISVEYSTNQKDEYTYNFTMPNEPLVMVAFRKNYQTQKIVFFKLKESSNSRKQISSIRKNRK